MRCPSCSAEIPDGSLFCQQCGASLSHDQSAPNVTVEVIPPAGQGVGESGAQPSNAQGSSTANGWQSAGGQSYGGSSSGQSFGENPSSQPFGGSHSGQPFGGNSSSQPFGGSPSGQPGYVSSSDLDIKAIASLVCGVVGFFFLTLILGTIAVVVANNVRRVTDPNSSTHKIATIGFVIGIVDLAFCVLTVLLSCTVGTLSGFLSVL